MVPYWKMFEPRVPGFVHIQTLSLSIPGREARRERWRGRGERPGRRSFANPRQRRLRRGADPRRRRRVLPDRRLLAARARHLHAPWLIADEIITGFCRTGRWFAVALERRRTSCRLPRASRPAIPRRDHGDWRDQRGHGFRSGPRTAGCTRNQLRPSGPLRGAAKKSRSCSVNGSRRTRRGWVSGSRPVSRRRSAITRTRVISGPEKGCSRRWSSWRIAQTRTTSRATCDSPRA